MNSIVKNRYCTAETGSQKHRVYRLAIESDRGMYEEEEDEAREVCSMSPDAAQLQIVRV